jgi:ABC-type branched-subunit amino acid transport system substrate-binding protein
VIDRTRAGSAALALAATAMAGCASTVQQTSSDGLSVAAGGTAGQPGAAPASGDPSLSLPGGTVGSDPVGGTAGSPSQVTGATSPGAFPSGGSTGGTGSVTQGVGVTPTKVFVGVTYTTNGDAANAALGGSSITEGDQKADAQAVIDDINAHGGVAGRTLVPVFHPYNAQSQATRANQDQAACSDFTEDSHVYAVIGTGLSDTLTDCLTKRGVLQIDSGPIIDPDNEVFRQHPQYFELGTLSQDRMMADYVATLHRLHYFTGWNTATGKPSPATPVKVGIISIDVPSWERPLDSVLRPALRAEGHPVAAADIVRVHNPESTSEDGQTVSQIEGSALRLRQDGVTHVILLDASGSLLLFMSPVARGQHYYPRFGINSGSGAQAIYDNGTVSSQQLRGSVGLGWLPSLDLSAAAGSRYATPATKHCLAVMKQRTGQTYTSTNAASIALGYCDQLYAVADAVKRAGSVINLQTGVTAIERLGSRFDSALLPSTYFSSSRHDAAETGFDMLWDSGCTCVKYVGRHRIP